MRSRNILFTISLIVLTQFEAFADSATQTDWSGGSGLYGPVTNWCNQFYLAQTVEWESNPGDIVLPASIEQYIGSTWAVSVYSTDIDGDSDMDVLCCAFESHFIIWWENIDGSGTSWTGHTVGDIQQPKSLYSEDIDGDGDMDVISASLDVESINIAWWENNNGLGTSWTVHTVEENFYGANHVYSEDIDGDGDMDILGAADDCYITWWENNNGLGTSWTDHTVGGSLGTDNTVYSEDIDGDGDMDVLGAAGFTDDITWWENNNGLGTSWTEHTVDGNFDGANHIYSEDIDGDGDMDILGSAAWDDDITWWENNNGLGTSWTEHTIDTNFDFAQSVYSEDMDGDGDMDVLGAAYDDCTITWWENIDGSGTSWIEYTLDRNFVGANSVYAKDINGDGYMDVLGAAYSGSGVTWWDLTEYAPEGSLVSSILDTQGNTDWDYLDWNATTPANTSVSFQVRASDEYTNMGIWSDTLTSPSVLIGLLNDGDRYVQYRAILSTSDPDTTSILNDITISWDQLGIGDEPQVTEYLLFGAEPNPAFASVSISFAVSELSPVELSIYDLTGRLVVTHSQREYSPGFHNVQFGDLSPGIYFCRMISGGFTAAQQFVVIE